MSKPMKIFVAGGAGFIGSNFIRRIMRRRPDARILNFDKLTYSGNKDNLAGVSKRKKYQFVQGDIENAAALGKAFKKFMPDNVINFEAETQVDSSYHGIVKDFM